MEYGRDLLYIKRAARASIQHGPDIEDLHRLLGNIETIHNLAQCTELADLNRFTITRKPHLIQQALRAFTLKPFCFLINRN